jgi:hypothetical protein
MKPSVLKNFYFIFITILFTLGFYRNQWRVVDMAEVQYRRDVSEIHVLGRLVKSRQDGVLSAGGLLGIGDVSKSSVESRVIKNQYDKYINGEEFFQYWTYNSTPGFQGIVFSLFDLLTNFTPTRNLAIFRLVVSLLLAAILSAFCTWIKEEAGWGASLLVAVFILISKWLTILGGNMYWCLWAFYLPLVVFPHLIKSNEKPNASEIFIAAFSLALVKILFTGFEFITTGLLVLSVPFVYYGVLDRWGWRLFTKRMISLVAAMISATMTGLIILSLQIQSVLGGYREAWEYIIFAWGRRTYGDQASWINPISVIRTYLEGHAFSLSSRLDVGSGIMKDLVDGKYIYLILIIAVATAVFLIRYKSSRNLKTYKVGFALTVVSWYSISAPLSWFVVFKEHAEVHTRLDFIVWQMPFMLYGTALIGFVISTWNNLKHNAISIV